MTLPRTRSTALAAVASLSLAAMLLTGPKLTGDHPWKRVPFRPLRFNFIAGVGEYFSLPFYTHTRGECRSFLFEAIPGGPMDRFQDARDGQEMLEIAQALDKLQGLLVHQKA